MKYVQLALILLLGLALRLYPLTQTQSLIGSDGYFHLVMVKETIRTGDFTFWNPLSQGGKQIFYPPGIYALSVPLVQLTGLQPEIIAMLFSFPFYLCIICWAFLVGGSWGAAALAFSPVFVWKTLTNFLPDPLWVFLLVISFRKSPVSIPALVALACSHSMGILASLYLLLMNIRSNPMPYFLVLVLAGSWFIGAQRDIPSQLQSFLFEGFNPTEVVKRAGAPLLGLLSPPAVWPWVLLMFAAAALKVIELDRALMASVVFLNKIPHHWVVLLLIVSQPLLAVYMMRFMQWAYPTTWLEPMKWLSENAASTVAGPYWLGYWIMGIAEKPNILDGNWEGNRARSEQLMADSDILLYGNRTQADPLLSKYGATFIIHRETKGYGTAFESTVTTISS